MCSAWSVVPLRGSDWPGVGMSWLSYFFSLPMQFPYSQQIPLFFLQTIYIHLFSWLYISIFLEKFCIIMYKTQTHIYKFNGYDIAALASNGSIYIIVKNEWLFQTNWLPWFHASLLFIIKPLIKTSLLCIHYGSSNWPLSCLLFGM